MYLLSNNMPWEDREAVDRLFKGIRRSHNLTFCAGLWLGYETFSRFACFNKLGILLKAPAFFLVSCGWAGLISMFGT